MADNEKTESSRNPCLSCTTVKDPGKCEIKTCKRWSTWFIERWNYWTALLRQRLKEGSDHGGNES